MTDRSSNRDVWGGSPAGHGGNHLKDEGIEMLSKRLAMAGVGAMLLGLALCEGPGQAQAGSLDKALLSSTTMDIVAYLKREGYGNVGVLPFKVKKGTRQATYSGGPIGVEMTRRFENALIMTQGDNEN